MEGRQGVEGRLGRRQLDSCKWQGAPVKGRQDRRVDMKKEWLWKIFILHMLKPL